MERNHLEWNKSRNSRRGMETMGKETGGMGTLGREVEGREH